MKGANNPFRLILRDPLALVGVVIVLAVVAMAAFAPFIASHDPTLITEEEEGSITGLVEGSWRVTDYLGDVALSGVDTGSDGRTVVVGRQGSVYYRAGGDWELIPAPFDADLQGVAVNGAGDFIVVGAAGTAALHAGGSWTELDAGTADLTDVAWLDEERAVIVGAAETILLYEAGSLTALESPLGRGVQLNAVARDGDGVLIVGARGVAIAADASGASLVTLPSFRDFNDVFVADSGDALIVGERGTLLRRVSGEWQEDVSPDSRALRGGVLLPAGGALAAGRNGVLLQLDAETDEWIRVETGSERHYRALGHLDGSPLVLGSDSFVNKLAPPSARHWFGTDHLGRDLFSQNVYGSRIALLVGFLGALLVVLIGTNVGLFAGYYGGRTDTILMRTVDVMYGIPFEPFAMILVLLFDPSLTIVIVAVSLLTWRTVARLIRSQVLSLSQRPFVKAARVAGASDLRILYLHIAPNILPLVLLQLAIIVGSSIIAEATLSFLGLGPPQSISWGGILHNARLSGAWRTAWWWNIPPGAFIMITVLGVFFISRALEVIANPRLRSR